VGSRHIKSGEAEEEEEEEEEGKESKRAREQLQPTNKTKLHPIQSNPRSAENPPSRSTSTTE